MTFTEKLKSIAQRIPEAGAHLETEEATKNALVMPFIAALGYDIFNPLEVVPEFTAVVGTKRGEKVDYAIKRTGEIIILLEVKKYGTDLAQAHANQLFRYFAVTSARLAVLTNGVQYRFYSDLDAPNRMDEKPFLEINMLDLRENLVAQLKKLTKEAFDLDDMMSAANDLKYMREIRIALEQQAESPSEEFVRFFFGQACPNTRFNQAAKDQFTALVRQAFAQFVSDRVSNRLRSALEREGDVSSEPPVAPSEGGGAGDERGIETTEEELDGFRIVKAIVCGVVAPDRVVHRDHKTYFGVNCDDNNRKPICRLHFNRSQKYIGLFDDDKNETRHAISSLDEIYGFADTLRTTAQRYVEPEEAAASTGQ